MKRIQKAWGTTIPILECPEVGLYFAEVQPGGYCSVHLHRFKWNRFYIRRGTLIVYWLAACGWNALPLADGEMVDVSAGIRHMFHLPGGCRLWESYVPTVPTDRLDPDDIVRFMTGGILNGLDDETPARRNVRSEREYHGEPCNRSHVSRTVGVPIITEGHDDVMAQSHPKPVAWGDSYTTMSCVGTQWFSIDIRFA